MRNKNMSSSFSPEDLKVFEILAERLFRQFIYDVSDLNDDAPYQEVTYLVAAEPADTPSIIGLEDVQDYLPEFNESDMLYGLLDAPIMMSYCPEDVLRVEGKHYLTGAMIFFRVDRDLSTISVTLGDLRHILRFLWKRYEVIEADGESINAICLD